MRASSLRGHHDRRHERGGRPAVAARVADVVRVVVEPVVVDEQGRRTAEVAVGIGSPLDARAVREQRAVRDALGVADGSTEVHDVGRGEVRLERLHVTTRRTHTVSSEESAGVERLDQNIARGLRIELGEHLRGELKHVLVLGSDLAVGRIVEVREDLLEHAEDVLHGDVVGLPALLRLLDALHDRRELRPDEQATVRVLRQHELAPVLRYVAVATFRRLGRGDVHVETLGERLDVAEVDARECRGEVLGTLHGRVGRPPRGVPPVRALTAFARERAGIARVDDDDAVGLFGRALLGVLDPHLLVHEGDELASIRLVGPATHPIRVVGVDADLCEDSEGGGQVSETNLVDRRSHDGVAS